MSSLSRCLLGFVLLSPGCAKQVVLRSQAAVSTVHIPGQPPIPLRDGEAAARVEPGDAPVPYTLVVAEQTTEGSIPRTDWNPWWLMGGVAGAVCCAPSLAIAGVLVVNPAIAGAGLACCLSQSPAVCLTAAANPTWWTLPAATLGASLGLLPLGLISLAREPADMVSLDGASPAPGTVESEVPF